MDFLFTLWIPIVLSAAAVWAVSIAASMALPHHKQDFIALPDEDGLIQDLRKHNIKPGNYLFPDFRTSAQLKSEKVERALEHGPVGHLVLWRTPLTMGDKMAGSFVVYLVVTILIAYLAQLAIPGPAEFSKIFKFVMTAGVLAYCFAYIPNALWWGSYKRTIVANIIDGVVFAAITGAIFGWWWPK